MSIYFLDISRFPFLKNKGEGGSLGLERLGLSRYDEAQGLDASAGELVSTGNLMFLCVESSARKKSHTTFYNEHYQVYVHCNMLVMILRGVI